MISIVYTLPLFVLLFVNNFLSYFIFIIIMNKPCDADKEHLMKLHTEVLNKFVDQVSQLPNTIIFEYLIFRFDASYVINMLDLKCGQLEYRPKYQSMFEQLNKMKEQILIKEKVSYSSALSNKKWLKVDLFVPRNVQYPCMHSGAQKCHCLSQIILFEFSYCGGRVHIKYGLVHFIQATKLIKYG